MSMSEKYAAPRYGNWRRPRTAGLGKLNFVTTLVMFVGLGVTVLLMLTAGLMPAVIAAAVFLVMVGATLFEDADGNGVGLRLVTRVGWWRTRRAGAHLYRSGPLGRADFGRFRAPGILARSSLVEGRDAFGRPFALVRMPATGHYALVFVCEPSDTYGVDDPVIDQWVANFGGWLAKLGEQRDVRAAAVTIETCPSTGAEFRDSLDRRRDPSAPVHSRRVVDELREQGAGGSVIRGWASVTFTEQKAGGGKRTEDQMLRDVAIRVPGYAADLVATGAGSVRAATASELCEMVRVSYDPASAALFEQARTSGQRVDLAWDEVGPAASQASWGSYQHDSGRSITWAMSGAPRGHVTSGVLTRLLQPVEGIERKRVTLLYQPLAPVQAVNAVESDLRNAANRGANARASTRTKQEVAAAQQSASEEAQGAGVVDFGLLVTATVTGEQDLAWARTVVLDAAGSSRMRLRVVNGSQDSAFAASLPLGVVLPEHVTAPKLLRQAVN